MTEVVAGLSYVVVNSIVMTFTMAVMSLVAKGGPIGRFLGAALMIFLRKFHIAWSYTDC